MNKQFRLSSQEKPSALPQVSSMNGPFNNMKLSGMPEDSENSVDCQNDPDSKIKSKINELRSYLNCGSTNDSKETVGDSQQVEQLKSEVKDQQHRNTEQIHQLESILIATEQQSEQITHKFHIPSLHAHYEKIKEWENQHTRERLCNSIKNLQVIDKRKNHAILEGKMANQGNQGSFELAIEQKQSQMESKLNLISRNKNKVKQQQDKLKLDLQQLAFSLKRELQRDTNAAIDAQEQERKVTDCQQQLKRVRDRINRKIEEDDKSLDHDFQRHFQTIQKIIDIASSKMI